MPPEIITALIVGGVLGVGLTLSVEWGAFRIIRWLFRRGRW